MEKGAKSRNFLITRNFRDGEDIEPQRWLEDFFNATKAVYLVGQLEQGLKEGRLHIQGYVNFKEPKRAAALCKVDAYTDYTVVHRDNGCANYCMKKDKTYVSGPWEFGKKPFRANNKDDWDEVRELAKKGDFDAIPSQIYIQHCSSLHKINELNAPKGRDIGHLRGVYIWGESGIGKSLFAREKVMPEWNDSMYSKAHNKWWTGFSHQKKVIWEDINPEEGKIFGNVMKLYCDNFAYPGEVKGANVDLDFELFIWTSQYPLEQVFTDKETYDAIKRRTYVYHMWHDKALNTYSQFSHEDMRAKLWGQVKPNLDNFLHD